ncbi:stage III sporulation protein AB [Thermoactinomyces intermedius]|jgi:stage III sporulation protein AB|uniref:Stage III sporulation protein AB n=1 Tax=Thermoactinomyces intermedius TaxID=2024 RepID=A0A8I1AAT6_THEIN|nr:MULTISPECIES: stage III sporulation protein SpoIIIAB [Thermoactinomyces]MBA4548564.1 stage III sporulation protein AB [Thermoactinomyces intermedius]MBA4835796.1 stage III sporulation protein AB [Thermoactinomyces intermedius]MBH8594442.1 stage III sporulation protein AB [Thermoactinomyces intermedius]MBH8601653.1 stage III sporulation protein AB [Thermoactinomyces sp. CICC 23799]MBI0390950.1 stage III sporulation protein AB [Thermoactinomyces sp. CICC 24226]
MLKVLGAVLILMATSKIGFDSARQLRKRPRQIQELRSGLAILKTEINYGTRPLAEAFERIAEASGELKPVFLEASRKLNTSDGKSTYECLKSAIEEKWKKTVMGEEEKGIVLKLCQVLGSSNRWDQLHHLDLAQENLQMEENKAREEQETYEKMVKTLGVLSGALLVILMF